MILIPSAAYVDGEFQIEFGRLPPAFLPLGNKRLFERQAEALRKRFASEHIYLTIPKSFALVSKDVSALEQLGIKVVLGNEKLSLSQALTDALHQIPNIEEPLKILHGDTLIDDIPSGTDVISLAKTQDEYQWEIESIDSHYALVWCGYFSFSRRSLIHDLLAKGSFTEAVRAYDGSRPMERFITDGWFDCGHINTYFQSRSRVTTERSFNNLDIVDGCTRKTGSDHTKIAAEAEWFAHLPTPLRPYCPQLIDYRSSGQPYYVLEYLPIPPLNEVFVHGWNEAFYWDKIFRLCSEFLKKCESHAPDEKSEFENSLFDLIGPKTWRRLDVFFDQINFDGLQASLTINGVSLPSLHKIVEDCIDQTMAGAKVLGVLHGDFCLSNILFDSRSDRIKVIDPRGMNDSQVRTIYGDLRYDLAKLTHSILGLYDHIIAGAYEIKYDLSYGRGSFELKIHTDERVRLIQNIFEQRQFLGGLTPRHIMPLTILLFLSMLPLHQDKPDRQMALFANALRLYADLLGSKEAA